MMRYRGAKFRGTRFLIIDEQSIEGGQRIVEHSRPFSNAYGLDKLGNKIHKISVRAIFLGDNYVEEYKRFNELLLNHASGELVHPFYPRGNYVIESWSGVIDPARQRIAYYDLVLIKDDDELSPISGINTFVNAIDSINNMINSVIDDIERAWQIVDPAIDALYAVNNVLETLRYGVHVVMGNGRIFEVIDLIDEIERNAERLVKEPGNLATAIVDATLKIRSSSDSKAQYSIYNRMNSQMKIADPHAVEERVVTIDDADLSLTAGYDYVIENTQYDELLQLLMRTAVLSGLLFAVLEMLNVMKRGTQERSETPSLSAMPNRIIPSEGVFSNDEYPIASRADAEKMIEHYADELNALAYAMNERDFNIIPVLDARLAVIEDISTRSTMLTKSENIVPIATIPAVVLLYQTKQNATQVDEFAKRNKLKNPLFCQGGEAYEVIND